MLKSFANCFKIPELRKRIIFTLAMLAVCRLMAVIPSPGIDQAGLNEVFDSLKHNQGASSVVGMFNLFTGDALRHFAVGALGIMPYITASIIISLMTPIFPTMEKWKREGESGYQKINQFTRYLTLAICVVQGLMAAIAMENPGNIPGLNIGSGIHLVLFPGATFKLMTVIVLTAGTMLLMWLGEQITDKGVGQGASLIITIGIIDSVPKALYTLWDSVRGGAEAGGLTPVHVFVLVGLFFLVTAATIALTVAVRKVPIQYARMQAGRSGPGQASFFPLRVNYATIMPIIFSSALLSFPPMLLSYLSSRPGFTWASYIAPYFDYASFSYMLIYATLTIVFCFFWVATQFNPVQISDDLKKSGAYVPGVRPGKPTADYLDWCMTRITTAGALMLTALALLPMLFNKSLGVPLTVSHFFGGTSLLIIVGVCLDTMRQIESHLMMHGYDSFLQRGRLRSRTAVGGISAQGLAQSAARHK